MDFTASSAAANLHHYQCSYDQLSFGSDFESIRWIEARQSRSLNIGKNPVPETCSLTGTVRWFRSAKTMLCRKNPLPAYFLSAIASAMLACWPASDTALMNASALLGVDALPERMLRNFMFLP